ncbi:MULTISPECIES: cupin domain-containing protein [Natrialbaceae]|uniref:cupin domain-containing protein n=1 Tax=Natrialbaceae TaxID=1644061 RepID=UPI00207C5DF9|nr:cupin domain-containing protein [Natronococcus sp. CG52]
MGRVLENPVTGERIAFREQTDAALRFDYTLEPGGFALGKVDHVHPNQEERFAIRSGRLGVRIDGDEWTATPGTRFSILFETPHTVWNAGADEMHAIVELRPGLELEPFFETMFGLARDGKTNDWGLPAPLQLAVLADAYREEFALAGVPVPIQRAMASATAPLGRLAGHRARYDRYGGET